MKLSYIFADPTGNTTALVTTPTAPENRAAAVAAVLATGVEQMGFLLPPRHGGTGRLEMMGFEFCGNAAMSAAAVLAQRMGVPRLEAMMEVSGASGLVPCTVEKMADGWHGTVAMELPEKISQVCLPGLQAPVSAVSFPGITHLMFFESPAGLEERMAPWCSALHVAGLGAMVLDRNCCSMEPLVYVPGSGTLVHEHGCCSGTAAVGAYMAHSAGKKVTLSLREPGGVMEVTADALHITVSGNIRLPENGREIELEY